MASGNLRGCCWTWLILFVAVVRACLSAEVKQPDGKDDKEASKGLWPTTGDVQTISMRYLQIDKDKYAPGLFGHNGIFYQFDGAETIDEKGLGEDKQEVAFHLVKHIKGIEKMPWPSRICLVRFSEDEYYPGIWVEDSRVVLVLTGFRPIDRDTIRIRRVETNSVGMSEEFPQTLEGGTVEVEGRNPNAPERIKCEMLRKKDPLRLDPTLANIEMMFLVYEKLPDDKLRAGYLGDNRVFYRFKDREELEKSQLPETHRERILEEVQKTVDIRHPQVVTPLCTEDETYYPALLVPGMETILYFPDFRKLDLFEVFPPSARQAELSMKKLKAHNYQFVKVRTPGMEPE